MTKNKKSEKKNQRRTKESGQEKETKQNLWAPRERWGRLLSSRTFTMEKNSPNKYILCH